MTVSEIVVRKKHHINMGNYENVEVEVGVTCTLEPGDVPVKIFEHAQQLVDEQLAEDLDRASRSTAEAETYVDTWLDGPQRRGRKSSRTR